MFFNLTCPFWGSTKQRQKIMPVRLVGLCTLAGFSKGHRFEKKSLNDISVTEKRVKAWIVLINYNESIEASIKSILDKPLPELHNLYEQMMPVLEHNRRRYMELTWSPNFDDTEFHS